MQKRIAEIISEYASQGDHRTGTDADHVNADWLKTRITALGVEPSETSFSFQRVHPVKATISLPSLSISGVPLYDCRHTDEQGISGRLGKVRSDAEIGVAMALPFVASEMGQRIHSARVADRHKAIVIVTDKRLPPDGAALLNAEHFTEPFGSPVLQIENNQWAKISAAIDDSATARVVVQCNYVNAPAINIGARIKGQNADLAPLVIMTPRSGWWRRASERGGGIACFIEMMRGLKEVRPQRDVIFTANTGTNWAIQG